jgi:hypothetical protein
VSLEATDLVLILDESGSMGHLRADTIGGVNTFVEEQRKQPGDAYVTLWTFSSRGVGPNVRQLFRGKHLNDVAPITEADYVPGGNTPLIDAVGTALGEYESLALKAPKAIFFIVTDGEENASQEYKLDVVRATIERLRGRGAAVVFLGANDSQWQAANFGVSTRTTAAYQPTPMGTANLYRSMSAGAAKIRSSDAKAGATADSVDWDSTKPDSKT